MKIIEVQNKRQPNFGLVLVQTILRRYIENFRTV